MLTRSVSRLAAPLITRQSGAIHAATPRIKRTPAATPAPAAFSTRAAPLAAVAQPAASSSKQQSTASASSSAHASAGESAGLSSAAAAAVAIAVVGVVSYAISEHSSEIDSATVESVRLQLRSWASRYGLSASECDAAAAEVRSSLLSSSRGPVASPVALSTAVAGADQSVAAWWRRVIATVVDQFLIQSVIFALTFVIVKIRPDSNLFDSPVKSMGASVLLSFILDVCGLLKLNGATPGKMLVGARTVRLDGEPMDVETALKHAFARMFISPVALFAEPTPLVFSAASRENNQLLHNWIANTIVVVDETDDE